MPAMRAPRSLKCQQLQGKSGPGVLHFAHDFPKPVSPFGGML